MAELDYDFPSLVKDEFEETSDLIAKFFPDGIIDEDELSEEEMAIWDRYQWAAWHWHRLKAVEQS